MNPDLPAPANPPFPWRLLAAGLVLLAAGHSFSESAHQKIGELAPSYALIFSLAAALGLAWCTWDLYQHRLTGHTPLSSLLGSVLTGHWLALDFHHWFKDKAPWWVLVVVGVAVFIVAAVFAHRWRHELERGRSLVRAEASGYLRFHRIRALVIIVSKPIPMPELAGTTDGFPLIVPPGRNAAVGTAGDVLRGESTTADIAALEQRKKGPSGGWNWQQTLRGLEPHIANLERVHLVGSDDAYLAVAVRFLARYLPALPAGQLTVSPAVDLENFENLMATLRQVALVDLPKAGFQPDEIAVDITGGIKLASVAGAVLTLNHAVVCQYVQTEGLNSGGTPQPFIYDFRWDPSLVLH